MRPAPVVLSAQASVPLPHHVAGLRASRRPSRDYTENLPMRQRKRLASAMAAAALAGWTLVRQEGDSGQEEFIATRGPETQRFAGLMQVEAWIDLLVEQRAATGAWGRVSAAS